MIARRCRVVGAAPGRNAARGASAATPHRGARRDAEHGAVARSRMQSRVRIVTGVRGARRRACAGARDGPVIGAHVNCRARYAQRIVSAGR